MKGAGFGRNARPYPYRPPPTQSQVPSAVEIQRSTLRLLDEQISSLMAPLANNTVIPSPWNWTRIGRSIIGFFQARRHAFMEAMTRKGYVAGEFFPHPSGIDDDSPPLLDLVPRLTVPFRASGVAAVLQSPAEKASIDQQLRQKSSFVTAMIQALEEIREVRPPLDIHPDLLLPSPPPPRLPQGQPAICHGRISKVRSGRGPQAIDPIVLIEIGGHHAEVIFDTGCHKILVSLAWKRDLDRSVDPPNWKEGNHGYVTTATGHPAPITLEALVPARMWGIKRDTIISFCPAITEYGLLGIEGTKTFGPGCVLFWKSLPQKAPFPIISRYPADYDSLLPPNTIFSPQYHLDQQKLDEGDDCLVVATVSHASGLSDSFRIFREKGKWGPKEAIGEIWEFLLQSKVSLPSMGGKPVFALKPAQAVSAVAKESIRIEPHSYTRILITADVARDAGTYVTSPFEHQSGGVILEADYALVTADQLLEGVLMGVTNNSRMQLVVQPGDPICLATPQLHRSMARRMFSTAEIDQELIEEARRGQREQIVPIDGQLETPVVGQMGEQEVSEALPSSADTPVVIPSPQELVDLGPYHETQCWVLHVTPVLGVTFCMS